MTVGLIVLLGVIVVIFVKTTLTKALLSDLQEKGIALTKHLAEMSVDNILTEHKLRLQMQINDFKDATKEIEYIFIHDKKGKVLVHTFRKGFPSDLNKINAVSPGEEYSIQSIIADKEAILDIAVPILKGETGVVHTGFSEQPLKLIVDKKVRFLVGIIIVILFIGSGAAILFTSAIIKPIYNLTKTAEQISIGNLEQKAMITTNDEIGRLGISFNKMVDKLKNDRGKIRGYTKSLEDMIRKVSTAKEELDQTNKKLQDINRKLTESNQELDEFTHIVSHDLKEPLRGIEAFGGFLQNKYRDKLDEKGKDYLNIITDSSKRMKRLIDDLLKISRITHRETPFENTNLNNILMGIKDNLSYALESKKCTLSIAGNFPTIYCDSTRIGEIFYNLIANSIKYNDKDSPYIEVGFNEKNDCYIFYVKDNGIGIEERYFDKIFRIFQRLERNDKEGTGAGLAIVKKIVDKHGGKVWVESKIGNGTAMFFTIPKHINNY